MSNPDPGSGGDRRTASRPEQLSVNRRGFFREILGMGLDKVDQAGKDIGKRLGDLVENKRENAVPPIAPKLEPPQKTRARGTCGESPATRDE